MINEENLRLHTASPQPPHMFPDIPPIHFAQQLTRIDIVSKIIC